MDKLKINLIPPEIKEKAKKDAKRSVINRASIGLLGVLILVTSGVLLVSIYQSVTLQGLNTGIEQEKAEVTALKEKEAVVFFLKNRIDSINKFGLTQYTQTELFSMITGLFPEGVNLISLQIDKSDKVLIQAETKVTNALDVFFNRLTDPTTNDDKISSVSVDSLSKSQNGIIRFSLTLNLKK